MSSKQKRSGRGHGDKGPGHGVGESHQQMFCTIKINGRGTRGQGAGTLGGGFGRGRVLRCHTYKIVLSYKYSKSIKYCTIKTKTRKWRWWMGLCEYTALSGY